MILLQLKELKEIIMNLDDSYEVYMKEREEDFDTVPLKSVEVSVDTHEVILKNW
jgi:hypothetical protein